jgi:hypothetical protein
MMNDFSKWVLYLAGAYKIIAGIAIATGYFMPKTDGIVITYLIAGAAFFLVPKMFR